MNNIETLLIVLAVLLGVGGILAIVLPYLKKKGVDVEGLIKQTQAALATVNKTLDTVRPFISDVAGVDTFDRILEAAHVGVGNAEQLYNVGKLEGEARKAAATEYINDTLKLVGVEITPEVSRLVDGAIEAEVLELKHSPLKAVTTVTSGYIDVQPEKTTP